MRRQKAMVAMVAALVVTAGITLNGDDDDQKSARVVQLTFTGDRIPADERVDWISSGEEVDVFQHLEAGKLTVIEFTAEW